MSSGMQGAVEQEEAEAALAKTQKEEREAQESYEKLVACLEEVKSWPKEDLLESYQALSRAWKDLSDVRLSRREADAFDVIEYFLHEVGLDVQ